MIWKHSMGKLHFSRFQWPHHLLYQVHTTVLYTLCFASHQVTSFSRFVFITHRGSFSPWNQVQSRKRVQRKWWGQGMRGAWEWPTCSCAKWCSVYSSRGWGTTWRRRLVGCGKLWLVLQEMLTDHEVNNTNNSDEKDRISRCFNEC